MRLLDPLASPVRHLPGSVGERRRTDRSLCSVNSFTNNGSFTLSTSTRFQAHRGTPPGCIYSLVVNTLRCPRCCPR